MRYDERKVKKMAKTKNKETVHTDKVIKCRVRVDKQFYPKPPAPIEEGKFGIITARVIDWDRNYEEPQLHPVYRTISVKGLMPELEAGSDKEYYLQAWETTSDYGLSYTIQLMSEKHELKTREQQEKFLRAIITERQVEALFQTFENPVDAILNGTVEDLKKVSGIGEKTAKKLMSKVFNSQDLSVIFTELADYNLTQREIDGLIMRYRNPKLIVDVMKKNPYTLMEVVSRVGFTRADEVAMNGGFNPRSSKRVSAFIQHYLEKEAEAGNSWVYTNTLIGEIDKMFADSPVSNEAISKALKDLVKKIMWHNEDKTKVGLNSIYLLEQNIARELKRLSGAENKFKFDDWESLVKEQELKQGWQYTEEQKKGIQTILESGVTLIQGLAGTGKTSCVAGMLAVFGDTYKTTACALSGRAATNIAESSSSNGIYIEGKTIHRLLQVKGEEGEFLYNQFNPLDYDIIILDEVSMVNATLFYDLIKAIPTGAKLIMLGDSGQLESIGIGNVMFDIIHSDLIPSVSLTKVHRQASKSAIITDSINVRNEEYLCGANEEKVEVRGELQDLVLDVYSDKEKTFTKIINYFKEELKHIDNIMDLIVVLPTRERGKASVFHVNNAIQEIIHPSLGFSKPYVVNEGQKNEFKIFEGDKVINNKNDYDVRSTDGEQTAIFNGNVGIVKQINHEARRMIVDFDMIGEVILEADNIAHLTLGYAITIHKCVTKDTVIFTDKGMMTLGDLDNQAKVGESKAYKGDIFVHNGYNLEKPSHFYNAGVSETLKIKTHTGNGIEGTLDHRTFVLNDKDGVVNRPFTSLKKGDLLIVNEGANLFGNEIKIPRHFRKVKREAFEMKYRLPRKLTPALARLLGMTFACLVTKKKTNTAEDNFIKLKTDNKEVLDQYIADSRTVFNYEPTQLIAEENNYRAFIFSDVIEQFYLNLLQPNKDTHPVIPSIILQAPKQIQLSFLQGVLALANLYQHEKKMTVELENGSYEISCNVFDFLELETNHKVITQQLKMMFLNVGIYVSNELSHWGEDEQDKHFTLGVIPASLFMEKVGWIGKETGKELGLKIDTAKHYLELKKENIFRECEGGKFDKNLEEISPETLTILLQNYLPNIQHLLFNLVIKNAHLMDKDFAKTFIKNYLKKDRKVWVKREVVNQVLHQLENKNVEDVILYNQIKLLADNRLEVITSIEESQAQTYCLTMPETNRFVQNGFIMSNCQGSGIKTVIMGIDYSAFTMLTKELVYTGITRAKKKCILVAENKALRKATKTSNLKTKQTFLKYLLNDEKL